MKQNRHSTDELRLMINERIEKEETKLQLVSANYIALTKSQKKNTLRKLNKLEKEELNIKKRIQEYNLDLIKLDEGSYKELNFFQKLIKKYKALDFEKKQAIAGYVFILPWLLGFIFFFAKPLLTTINWSFNNVVSVAGGLERSFIGFDNYKNLFTTQMLGTRTFMEVMTSTVSSMLINLPIIFIFSMLVAVVLNTKFKGHQFFKLIFFIPVVYNSTVISLALSGSFGASTNGALSSIQGIQESIETFLLSFGFGEGLVKFLISSVDHIFTIVTKSGIQILIFISALQTIPKHLYEAAKIEGANGYDAFCKITFPMLSKIFIPVIIYTIVDSFATSDLLTVMTVNSDGAKISYGVSSAIAVIYFLVNLLIIFIIVMALRKAVQNEK